MIISSYFRIFNFFLFFDGRTNIPPEVCRPCIEGKFHGIIKYICQCYKRIFAKIVGHPSVFDISMPETIRCTCLTLLDLDDISTLHELPASQDSLNIGNRIWRWFNLVAPGLEETLFPQESSRAAGKVYISLFPGKFSTSIIINSSTCNSE